MNATLENTIERPNSAQKSTKNEPSMSRKKGPPTTKTFRVGPYFLGKTLGTGSTGRVKLGTHMDNGKKVAIKILNKALFAANEEQSRKLEREITIMKLIQHPNVMSLHDVYETKDELFLILDHLEGGELFDYLVKKGRLNEDEARKYFAQIISAVDFCHQHFIYHRDLKPENLLLDFKMDIKVADFGMASIQQTGKLLETSCGSPHYACPEIIRGEKYDGGPADTWSCGVILYALLAGRLPFDDENIRRLLNKVKAGKFEMPPFISVDAADLINKMIEVDVNKRISLHEAMKHPWFTKHEIKLCPAIPAHRRLKDKILSVGNAQNGYFDPEILKSLALLGWGDLETLKRELSSLTENPEKVCYYLLLQRKLDYLENQEGKSSSWDFTSEAKRRTESYNSLQSDSVNSDSVGSLNEISQPIFSSGKNDNNREFVAIGTRQITQINQVLRTNLENSKKAFCKPPTGIGSGSSPLSKSDETIVYDDSIPKESTRSERKFNEKLKISIPDVSNLSLGSSSMGTPRFHRRGMGEGALPSPILTHTPKKSWFSNLFSFKPESFTFLVNQCVTKSGADDQLRNILTTYKIDFHNRKPDEYRCTREANEEKIVKFKIEIEESKRVQVNITHISGPINTFREICQIIFDASPEWILQE
ncbi:Protein kinase, catalytic domain-containing protein [Rozella allomycis CSF55]|uniref:non-specific serine/threonine protein kinase n=1 Tax=Rozella allomycis (strain CSF55) TaxID=988480 RepID=A0A075ATJ5_ROZAC|nr:Protein kinase, catalytic domain-containing protein [Rozella allomycis CSF55]|eukprot:EPZ31872.1 Protein kinase, catalytic domain-containing protein [Rozella allomycis CSF55]